MQMRTWVWIGCCVGAMACLDSNTANHVDAGRDAMERADAFVDVCGREAAAQAELLSRARAVSCARDQDCTLIGSCDEGFGFVAVPLAFAAETQALMDATECDSFDGPSYRAVCEDNRCVARENGGVCGSDEPPFCAGAQLQYDNPCGSASPDDARIQAGCHTPCDPTQPNTCPDATLCRATGVCPVGFPPQAEGCFQCEAITVSLCVPLD